MFLWILLFSITITLTGCHEEPTALLYNIMSGKDRSVPTFLGAESTDKDILTCSFDEIVYGRAQDIDVEGNSATNVTTEGHNVHIQFEHTIPPGVQNRISAFVKDATGNSLFFSTSFWGCNPDLPDMVINEFSTKGNTTHPDRVEILILEDGNIAGATLCDGIGHSFDSEFVFPSTEVHAGDRLVVWYTTAPDNLAPLHYYAGETGLGANNGVLTLTRTRGSKIIDAVLYSNRTSQSDSTYGGFGTKKVQERALLLEEKGGWVPVPLQPESGIDSTHCTATRTMCRDETCDDSDTKYDWYVVPTSSSSFGEPNCQDIYQP